MSYQIQLVKLKSIRTGKEWYKEKVGNYYAVYAEPFPDNDPYFGGQYLAYHGIGAETATRLSRFNVDVLTEPFSSKQLEEKQQELGIDILHDYASEKAFLLVSSVTNEVLPKVFKTYFAAHQYLEENEELKEFLSIEETELIA